jgi:hypothetical protein
LRLAIGDQTGVRDSNLNRDIPCCATGKVLFSVDSTLRAGALCICLKDALAPLRPLAPKSPLHDKHLREPKSPFMGFTVTIHGVSGVWTWDMGDRFWEFRFLDMGRW